MIGRIDGHYVAAQVRMVRQIHKGTILILEGETDARVFNRFVDAGACEIEVAFGKQNVLQALDLLEDEGFPGVVAVVDADFDRLLGRSQGLENLCVTDCHDLDLTIFGTCALQRYIVEHAEPERLKSEFKSDIHAIRAKIIESTLPLAYCRLISENRNLRLFFGDLQYDKFVRLDDLSVNTEELLATLIARSSTSCTVANLTRLVNDERANSHDPYQLANGHDVAAILGIALRKMLAARRFAQTWASEIEAGLRLAFDWEGIAETTVYKCLEGWETNNRPYRIFRERRA